MWGSVLCFLHEIPNHVNKGLWGSKSCWNLPVIVLQFLWNHTYLYRWTRRKQEPWKSQACYYSCLQQKRRWCRWTGQSSPNSRNRAVMTGSPLVLWMKGGLQEVVYWSMIYIHSVSSCFTHFLLTHAIKHLSFIYSNSKVWNWNIWVRNHQSFYLILWNQIRQKVTTSVSFMVKHVQNVQTPKKVGTFWVM